MPIVRWTSILLTAQLAIMFEAANVSAPAAIPPETQALLQRQLGFSPSELAAIDRGRPAVRSLRAGDRHEVATAGAVRIDVPPGLFVDRFNDIVSFKRSPLVLQIGKFSSPPRLDDLERLALDQADVDALRRCRVGNCGLQLTASQIQRFAQEMNWSNPDAPDARGRANKLFREMLLESVTAYQTGGNSALPEYRDRADPVRAADELRVVVGHSSSLLHDAPELTEYLMEYPRATSPRVQDFMYWSREQFGLKPVVSVTHAIVYTPQPGGAADLMIASKQIYASHYFDGSLALTLAAVDRSVGGNQVGFYMLYANRTRSASLPPLIGGIVRRVINGRTKSGMEEQLRLTKQRLEAEYAKQ